MSTDEIRRLRARVRELEDRLTFVYQHLGIEYQGPPNVSRELIEFIKSGLKIQAIKLYREMHNVGLAEAKDAVEEIAEQLR